MKVVLVRPNYKSHIITPPLGLGYLSSFLKEHGIDTKIIDGLRDNVSKENLVKHILAERPEAVGITCLTAFYKEVVELSRMLKTAGQKVVIGGVHPTFLPYDTLKDSGCDYVVLGEAELALLKLAQSGFVNKGISGVYSTADLQGGEKQIAKAERIEKLDELPFPDWEQMNPRSYPKAPHGAIARNYPIGVITTTRGCPCTCTFCASPGFYDGKIRFRTPSNVMSEIKFLVDHFGVREIHFEDDNFTFRRQHVETLCNLIIESGIEISWACPNGVRADKVDENLISLMKKSGCYYFAYGIESANQEILDNVRKHEKIIEIEQSINLAARCGISCQGFFIFGLPGETRSSIDQTIRFAKESRLARAQFLILDVVPGSELWLTLKGKFMPDWTKNSFKEPEWIPEGLTRECLLESQSRAFREFYFKSPLRMARLACRVRPSQIIYLLRRLLEYRIVKP